MIEIDGLYKAKEQISILVGRTLTKNETNCLDFLLEDEEIKIENVKIKRKLETISTFLIEESQNGQTVTNC